MGKASFSGDKRGKQLNEFPKISNLLTSNGPQVMRKKSTLDSGCPKIKVGGGEGENNLFKRKGRCGNHTKAGRRK